MSHLMKNGQPCARPDGHNGKHASAEAVLASRRRVRAWQEANKERDRERRRAACRRGSHRYQNETLDRPATIERRYQPWTGAELETLARTDLNARQIARLLNRTFLAVQSQRHLRRMHHDEETAA